MRGPTFMLGPVRMLMPLYCANACGVASVTTAAIRAIDRNGRTRLFVRMKDRLPWPVSIM